MVPDKFINSKILASASGTHDISRNIIPYSHNKKNILLNCLLNATGREYEFGKGEREDPMKDLLLRRKTLVRPSLIDYIFLMTI